MSKPGPDSTLRDVRALLVQTGVDDLLDAGIGTGVERLKLAEVIAAAGVSRATAYRSLLDDQLTPQELLRQDVLTQIVGQSVHRNRLQSTETVAAAEFERSAALYASDDVSLRTRAMRNVLRIAANKAFEEVAASRDRAILTAMAGALRSIPTEQMPAERLALRAGEEDVSQRFVERYNRFSELFGYRLRSSYQLRHFSTAVASMIEGTVLRDGYSDYLTDITRNTGPDGSPESWSLFAVMFEATYVHFWEPSNADRPFADLSLY